jgi:hypothetical protein
LTEQRGTGMQHSSLAGPGQKPGTEACTLMPAHTLVAMHVPPMPSTLQLGAGGGLAGGVQHSSLAGPGQ